MTMEQCRICDKPSVNSCAACRSTFYCSAEHQKLDWKEHKSKCLSYIIKSNEELERYSVASRSLKAGSVVLEEIPVIYSPFNPNGDQSIPICLSCCKIMQKDFRECSKCMWPICSDTCEQLVHADLECKIFSKNDVKYPPNTNYCYMGVMALRACLLQTKKPEILNLKYQLGSNKNDANSNRRNCETQMTELKVTNLFSVDEWSKIVHMITVNARDLDIELFSKNKKEMLRGKYLFLNGSFFKNSCSPNCVLGISPGVNAKLIVRTASDVKKGDLLTVAHNGINYLHGTIERQREIRKRGGLFCKCDRCLDSTELSSNISTLVCTTCNAANVTSTNPLDEHAPWKCSSCNSATEAADIINLVDSKCRLVRDYPLNSTNINGLVDLITDLSGIILHPNHWIINEIRDKIFKFLESKVQSNPKAELSDDERRIYLDVTEHLLKVTNCVSPGLSKNTAKLLSCLSREKTVQTENDFINGKTVHSEFKEEIRKLDEMIHDAYQFFKTDTTEFYDGAISPEATSLESRIDQMKTLVLLASNEYLPVKLSSKK